MSAKHFVFLTLDSKESRFLYSGFEKIENGQILYMNRGIILNRFTRPIIQRYTNVGRGSVLAKLLTQGAIYRNFRSCEIDSTDKDLVFVLYARVYETFGKCITDALRKRYPNSKVCVYFGDILKWFRISLEQYLRDFDYVFTFDKSESERWGIHFLQEPFSYISLDEDTSSYLYDITYVGDARTSERYNAIIKVYEQCKNANLKCDFHITCVEKEKQKYPDEIDYNCFMDFEEIVKHVIESRTVLEIVQNNGFSPTTRYAEACIYGRNLITNCIGIKNGFYEKDNNIFLLNEDLKVDTEWAITPHSVNKEYYKEKFSIEKFVETIGSVIDNDFKQ